MQEDLALQGLNNVKGVKHMTKADKIIVACMMVISIVSMLAINIFMYADTAASVIIEVDGKPYAQYQIQNITSPEVIEIYTQYGYNKVEITTQYARILEADCADRLCISKGDIQKTNQMVICLPNRLVIRIEGNNTDVDGVTY